MIHYVSPIILGHESIKEMYNKFGENNKLISLYVAFIFFICGIMDALKVGQTHPPIIRGA